MKIGIIGMGKVGASLGQYFVSNGLTVSGVYDIHEFAAKTGADLIKTVCFDRLEDLVLTSDVLFLTVTDDAVKSVWEQISQFNISEKIVCHCSGALSSAVFTGIRTKGAYGYSVHPVMTISHNGAVAEMKKTPFTIEGDNEQLEQVKGLFVRMGNSVQFLRAEQKIRYHAAAVFASNFIVALAGISMDLLADCGFDEAQQHLFLPLMQASVENIVKTGPVGALTGPIERGDSVTISKHLADLTGEKQEIYSLLSKKIVDIAKQKNPQKNVDDLLTILSKK